MINGLRCIKCKRIHQYKLIYQCEKCRGTLDIEYDYEKIFGFNWIKKDEFGIWKYQDLMPVKNKTEFIYMGEGQTPFFKMAHLSHFLNHSKLYIKNESLNPTLAFKDRSLTLALSVAKDFQVEKVITASTGNTGVAAAAYAARANMPCVIYVPEAISEEKLAMMRLYGADIHLIDGHFSDAYQAAEEAAQKNGWFNLTSTFMNPFAIEGNKTVAYEIFDQYKGVPDWILVPIGAGPLLVSIYKGFKELQIAGLIDQLPRMVGTQASGCAPIVRAFEQGEGEVRAWEQPDTIASAIADPLTTYPEDGTRTLQTILESNGAAIAVPDDDILDYQKKLARFEGVFAETSSVTAVAAIPSLIRDYNVDKNHSIVTVITGHGLKDLKSLTI